MPPTAAALQVRLLTPTGTASGTSPSRSSGPGSSMSSMRRSVPAGARSAALTCSLVGRAPSAPGLLALMPGAGAGYAPGGPWCLSGGSQVEALLHPARHPAGRRRDPAPHLMPGASDRAAALGGALRVAYLPNPLRSRRAAAAALAGWRAWRARCSGAAWAPSELRHHFRWRGPGRQPPCLTAWLHRGYGTLRLLPSSAPAFASALNHWLERQAGLGELQVLMPVGDGPHRDLRSGCPPLWNGWRSASRIWGGCWEAWATISRGCSGRCQAAPASSTAVHDGRPSAPGPSPPCCPVARRAERGKQAAEPDQPPAPAHGGAALGLGGPGGRPLRPVTSPGPRRPDAALQQARHLLIENAATTARPAAAAMPRTTTSWPTSGGPGSSPSVSRNGCCSSWEVPPRGRGCCAPRRWSRCPVRCCSSIPDPRRRWRWWSSRCWARPPRSGPGAAMAWPARSSA